MKDECKPLLDKAMELFLNGKMNRKLNIFVNGEYLKNSNVFDYLLDIENKLPFSKEFKIDTDSIEINNKREKIYTKLSPEKIKNSQKKHWIF